jgi:hypothetical protein
VKHPPELQRILDYLHDIVCEGDEGTFDEAVKAIAHGCQHPDEQEEALQALKLIVGSYRPCLAELSAFNGESALDSLVEKVFASEPRPETGGSDSRAVRTAEVMGGSDDKRNNTRRRPALGTSLPGDRTSL